MVSVLFAAGWLAGLYLLAGRRMIAIDRIAALFDIRGVEQTCNGHLEKIRIAEIFAAIGVEPLHLPARHRLMLIAEPKPLFSYPDPFEHSQNSVSIPMPPELGGGAVTIS